MVRFQSMLAIASVSGAVVAANSGPIVDVGYAQYEGYYNGTYDINIWKSIRYAAPPVGDLRWQRPHPPRRSKCRITPAKKQPPLCPQSGAFGTPAVYGFNSALGNEDCLYLNVYAAPNATKQPVFIWIHGGGHSVFGATYDPSELIKTNGNGFITVEIQYRLGAFGYLSSNELKKRGALNAGLLDQRFAMEWVQQHIEKFGGDPRRVTIGGESSGAGSVMIHSLGYGGQDHDLFNNIIAASPYSPPMYPYNHQKPEGNYAAFAELAGCGKGSSNATRYGSTFDCLVASDTVSLQKASGIVSTTRGYFGSFAFFPVVDGDYIQDRPSSQLLQGKATGKALLVGTNANEGVPLTNPEIKDRVEFDAFVSATLPNFAARDIKYLNELYQIKRAADPEGNFTRFDTQGTKSPTALTQSDMATGIQQAAFNIAAESIFHCPAQWMAETFSVRRMRVWKYQFSLTPSFHGADLSSYFSVGATLPSADFRHAFHKVWGNFIMQSNPTISETDATAQKDGAVAPIKGGKLDWPIYEANHPTFMNFNTTGGNVSLTTVTNDLSYHVRSGEGVINVFHLADGSSWEGGRGERCKFWQRVASRVPY